MRGFIDVDVVASECSPQDQVAVRVVLDESDLVLPVARWAGAITSISVGVGCGVDTVEGDKRNLHGQSLASHRVIRRHPDCVIGSRRLAHLLVVTGLVVEGGGDQDQAIAAMLHDAVEDGGGRSVLDRIARAYGRRVAEIVEGCSDTIERQPVETWIDRKRRYLAHLQTVEDEAVLGVALADKVHNARPIVREYRRDGHGLWERFGDRSVREELWCYGGLLELFERRRPGPLTDGWSAFVTAARIGASWHLLEVGVIYP
jgi:hypothetical protein